MGRARGQGVAEEVEQGRLTFCWRQREDWDFPGSDSHVMWRAVSVHLRRKSNHGKKIDVIKSR